MKRLIVGLIVFSLLIIPFSSNALIIARSGCCSWHGGVCGCGCCDGTSLSSTCAPYYPECYSKPVYTPAHVAPVPKPDINKFSYTDTDLDNGFLYECIQKVYNDKYLYRKGGINYYDSQCSYRLNRPVEEWIVTNGLATASPDIHKWAYWLIKFFNTVNK